MPRIPYETDAFPAGTVLNGHAELSVTWDDILWAAVTVGRPNRHYVFRHGVASVYEALFRWSLVRMALEQRGPRGSRLYLTTAAKTLDPTEKGAVNYFLGMTFCKLFAFELLNTPWLLHLDVFRPTLNPTLTGRSRPDLVGLAHGTGEWHAFECKGRVSPPDAKTKAKAKAQAQSLFSVMGIPCTLRAGAITFFRAGALQFYWGVATRHRTKRVAVPKGDDVWKHYYQPVIAAAQASDSRGLWRANDTLVDIYGANIKVGVHSAIAKYLEKQQWERAQRAATEATASIAKEGYQPDGLKVVAGESWVKRFAEIGMAEEGGTDE